MLVSTGKAHSFPTESATAWRTEYSLLRLIRFGAKPFCTGESSFRTRSLFTTWSRTSKSHKRNPIIKVEAEEKKGDETKKKRYDIMAKNS